MGTGCNGLSYMRATNWQLFKGVIVQTDEAIAQIKSEVIGRMT